VAKTWIACVCSVGKWICMTSNCRATQRLEISRTKQEVARTLIILDEFVKEGWLMSSSKSGVSSAGESGSVPNERGKLARSWRGR